MSVPAYDRATICKQDTPLPDPAPRKLQEIRERLDAFFGAEAGDSPVMFVSRGPASPQLQAIRARLRTLFGDY